MNKELEKLKYGSLEKIKEAYRQGAGVFFREDVAILLDEIDIEMSLEIHKETLEI
jgi:hypothetical protein